MGQAHRKTSRLAFAGLAAALVLGTAGGARAEGDFVDNLKLELGAFGGVHLFANDLELGVADDPTLTSPKNSGLFGLRLGLTLHPMFTFEVEGVGLPTSDRVHDFRAFLGSARAQLRFDIPATLADGKLQPFVLAGIGGMSVLSTEGTEYDELKKDTDFIYQFGAGAKYSINELLHVRLDARLIETPNTTDKGVSADWEFSGGLGLTFGGAPPAPPPPPPPPPVVDTDKDGLPDKEDTCPTVAGPRDNKGCPDRDRDKDGVVDRKDKCPDEAGVAERDGCPVPDKDKDGVLDDADKCPTEPEDVDKFEDEDGCPDPDNDKDGVADANDKCPLEPETKNGFQDEDGCPDELPVSVKKFTGVVRGITFRRNSADIKASSFPFLKEAVKTFKEFPQLRIEVSGHTSNDGKRDFNVKLSKKRAESVKAFLVSAGIEENRVLTVGYGPDKPIEDNSTKAGQEKNRRIEFRLLSPDETTPPSVPESVPEPAKPAKATKEKKTKGDAAMAPGTAEKPAKAEKAKAEKPAAPEKTEKAEKPAKPAAKAKATKAAPPPDDDPTPSPTPKKKK